MLFQAAPVAAPAQLVCSLLRGVAPYVALAAGARLVGLAPELATSREARQEAGFALLLFAVASIAARVVEAVGNLLSTYVGFQVDAVFESERMAAVCALPGLEHFESQEHADRLELSVRAAQFPKHALSSALHCLQYGSGSVAALVIIGRIGWWAPALIAATSLPVIVTAWRHAGRRNVYSRMISTEMRYALYHWLLPLTAPREIRLFGLGEWLRDRQETLYASAMAPHFEDVRREFRTTTAISAAKAVAVGIPILVTVVSFSDGDIGLATFSAVIAAIGALGTPLRWFEGFFADLRTDTAFLPDAFDVIDLPRTDPRLDVAGIRVPPPAPQVGIAFEGVTFRYPGSSVDVLQGLDLVLPAGQTTALVGENGAGKSTIVKLLCRMYDPTEGRITLDGVDLREFDLAILRRRFAVLTQQFLRLPMSLRVNVGIGCVEQVNDQDLLAAAARDGGADAVAERSKEGWSTNVTRDLGGVDLSGGEWQRVALSRAMAARRGRGASILVLDEPTAALDVRLEHDLYTRFSSLTEGATTLLISHRYSTVRMAEDIAVLDRGRIVEAGSHAELVQASGMYARLYRLQASRFASTGAVD